MDKKETSAAPRRCAAGPRRFRRRRRRTSRILIAAACIPVIFTAAAFLLGAGSRDAAYERQPGGQALRPAIPHQSLSEAAADRTRYKEEYWPDAGGESTFDDSWAAASTIHIKTETNRTTVDSVRDTETPSVLQTTESGNTERPAVPKSDSATSQNVVPPAEGLSAAEQNTAANWKLTLVNPWNTLPDPYSVTLTQLKNGHSVDERCYPDLQAMMDACRAAGLSPVICSSYRTREKQEALYTSKVNKLLARGYSKEDAKAEAAKAVAVPGTSEHQLGLAVDIVDINNQNLDKTQESTAVQKWLMAHSWEYGFILRYPDGKSGVTGIIYEPWHYRYVGKDAAKEIYDQGVCLEEYLSA